MRLLLISNSTNPGEGYLEYPIEQIKTFLGEKTKNALFIPYAAVTFSYEEYEEKVNNRFAEIGHHVTSIHRYINPIEAIENADAIVVGGGNTWQLVKILQEKGLMKSIKKKVKKGTPYIGWSAGSNIACPTLRTTNDMPIVQPLKFKTLKLVPFQINPHYLDDNPANHGGETREVRINEFIEVNRDLYVVGLREGTMLLLEDKELTLIGNRKARIFKYSQDPLELSNEDDFSFLLETSLINK
ncbi:MAG: dipeptidase PepE [Dysgonamonadaceae bacterium]|nr:dipeptidase PepE [Dysgonamonadaceae bacterium]MDD3309596.1 dipeptidase PepE [Dysgonamonadaceae bacterium]MDD3901483.1 dipeptidase PepE [Dysgonamonadaceae bacterium]MDD4398852.1 dipeptidase PepE [Dysgonamonadaceae bacterium]MEA5082052.1 dipeptidase PepE [Dysgonamonadaceae bacterium]